MGILERLRSDGENERQRFREARATLGPLLADAAARIEQLEEANELMLTDIRRTDVDMLAFKARIEQLEAALRPLACTCEARHQADCSRSEVDCPFWNARAALEERT